MPSGSKIKPNKLNAPATTNVLVPFMSSMMLYIEPTIMKGDIMQ